MDPDQEWADWRDWLGAEPTGETIRAQIFEMVLFRQIWDVFAFMHNKAPEAAREDRTFAWWVAYTYSRNQALGVRRMTDMTRGVRSLARLIDRVWRYPTVLSRERFLAMQTRGEELDRMAQGWFDSMAGTGDYIDPRIPAQDFDDLYTKTAKIRKWVNTSVAHVTLKGRPRGVPPLGDIHDAVDVVADLFMKYNALIYGENFQSGVTMSYWPTVFRVAWIPDDDHFRTVLDTLDEAERRRGERGRDLFTHG
jgi:hypothetical protein